MKRISLLPSYEHPAHATAWRNDHRLRGFITGLLLALLTLLALLSGGAAIIAHDMQRTIKSNRVEYIPPNAHDDGMNPVDINAGTAINIMIIGQDTRSGSENAAIGGGSPEDADNHQSDTNMIAHISADRSHVDIISLPRDSMIDAPACNTGSDILPARKGVMLNSVFPTAYNASNDEGVAASCLVNTVNSLTGLDIQQFVLVDFGGLSDMINAIGGVDVCIPQDLQDDNTGLDLKRGLQHLDGVQATQYARIRHGLNTDGSDIMRTVRQQHLVKSLMSKLKDSSTLSNPSRLYNLANAALKHVRISSGLADVGTLTGLAYSLRGMNMATGINAITVPTEPYAEDANRVQWSENAEGIWDALRTDKPVSQAVSKPEDNAGNADSQQAGEQAGTQPQGNNGNNGSPDNGGEHAGNDGVDANIGLRREPDGRLIDPATGGIVNPDNGAITDTNTGSIIGFADKYVEYTYCKAK